MFISFHFIFCFFELISFLLLIHIIFKEIPGYNMQVPCYEFFSGFFQMMLRHVDAVYAVTGKSLSRFTAGFCTCI